MKHKLAIVVALLALILGGIVAVFILSQSADDRAAIPFQYMWVYFEDEDGVATIRSDAFRIAFEGHSFGPGSRGGSYAVDGRYERRLFGARESTGGAAAGDLAPEYSQAKRLLTCRYQGHDIAFSHSLKIVTVDGQEHSTANGQVRLVIKANGVVEKD